MLPAVARFISATFHESARFSFANASFTPRERSVKRNSAPHSRLSKSQQHLTDSYERFNEARSYHSRSTCGLHSIPSGLVSLPDPLPYTRGSRADPDRLNILDWPDPPRRYRSVQNLDTVSGLVDIVEDNWPIEGNRSIDCIYTQVNSPLLNYGGRSSRLNGLLDIRGSHTYKIHTYVQSFNAVDNGVICRVEIALRKFSDVIISRIRVHLLCSDASSLEIRAGISTSHRYTGKIKKFVADVN